MHFNQYESLDEALVELKKRGFINTFSFEGSALRCDQNDKAYHPGDLKIVELHRFHEKNENDIVKVIFALMSNDGIKGYMITSSGDPEDIRLRKLMDKIKIKFQRSDQ